MTTLWNVWMHQIKGRKEIEGLFIDFTEIFPVSNYDFLYTKDLTGNIEKDKVSILQILSYLYTEKNDITRIGIKLSFIY